VSNFKYPVGDGDVIKVPMGTNIGFLVSHATSDGHGGTLLTHSLGTINLVGVDPATVSADWFV
jgi:hypothetical protein